jgi:hypothetical protein
MGNEHVDEHRYVWSGQEARDFKRAHPDTLTIPTDNRELWSGAGTDLRLTLAGRTRPGGDYDSGAAPRYRRGQFAGSSGQRSAQSGMVTLRSPA